MREIKCSSVNKSTQNGFSMLEVLITLIVSSIALLGLAAGQLKSLQYAYNSYQYTVSLIQANNVVERILNDVCILTNGSQEFDTAYVESTLTVKAGYKLNWDSITTPIGGFITSFPVYISWDDHRMIDSSDNEVKVMANLPIASSSCSV